MKSGAFGKRFAPYLDILRLSWPLALGMVNNAVMQFIDRAYLANSSLEAFDAVLPASTLSWVFGSFFQSVVAYAGVFIAQYHGAGNPRMCARSYRAATLIAVAAGLMMTQLVPLANAIIALTAPSETIALYERDYCDITMFGGFFVFGQMAASSYFTGRGSTRVVFGVNLLGNLLNIALDPFLIFGWCGLPALGIAGAAYATVGATAVQWIVLAVVAERRVRTAREGAATASLAALVGRILRFGIPSGAYSVLSMLSFTTFVFVTEQVGRLECAVSNAVFTLNYLLYAPMEGFAIGAQTLVGQARGRGDDAEADRVAWRTVVLASGICALAAGVTLVFHRPVLALFAPADSASSAEFLSLGFTLVLYMGAYLVLDAADTVLCGALKGAGDTVFVMGWITFCAFGIWMPLVWFVSRASFTMPHLWMTTVVYVLAVFTGSFLRWRRGVWRRIRLVRPSPSRPSAELDITG